MYKIQYTDYEYITCIINPDTIISSRPDIIFHISVTIILVVIVIGYCIYMIIRKSIIGCSKCSFITKIKGTLANINDDEQCLLQQSNINPSLNNDDFDADRIRNPDNYEERHFPNTWLESNKQSQNATPSDIPFHQAIADDHDGSDDDDDGGGSTSTTDEEDI